MEQAKQESSTSTAAPSTAESAAIESSSTSDGMQSTSISIETADRMENGYPIETAIISENKW